MYVFQAHSHHCLGFGREECAINNVKPGIERVIWVVRVLAVGLDCDCVLVPKPETLWRWKRRIATEVPPVEIDELAKERLTDECPCPDNTCVIGASPAVILLRNVPLKPDACPPVTRLHGAGTVLVSDEERLIGELMP